MAAGLIVALALGACGDDASETAAVASSSVASASSASSGGGGAAATSTAATGSGGGGGAAPVVPCSPDGATFAAGDTVPQASVTLDHGASSCAAQDGLVLDAALVVDDLSDDFDISGSGYSVVSTSHGTPVSTTGFYVISSVPADTPLSITLASDADGSHVTVELTIVSTGLASVGAAF